MAEFASISFLVLAVLYGAICVLLLTDWRPKLHGGFFLAACAASGAWAMYSSVTFGAGVRSADLVFEVLRFAAWTGLLVTLLARLDLRKPVVRLLHGIWLTLGGITLGAVALSVFEVLPYAGPRLLAPAGLVMALTGLVYVEQLYRNMPPASLSSVKALAIGLGAMFVYDLIAFSQLMVESPLESPVWAARGAVNILCIPLLVAAARQNRELGLDIVVSRKVVFYSATLIGVGVYLLLMSLGGYVLLTIGGAWANLALVVFIAGGALALVALLSSRRIRARAKVYLNKHFFNTKYDYREEWLRLTATLGDFESSSTREVAIRAIARVVDSPGGLLWFVDEDDTGYRLMAAFGYAENNTRISASDPLIRFIKREGWLIDLDELARDPELYGNLALPPWLARDRNAWLIVPLMFRHELLGLVLLARAPGRRDINFEDRDLLKTIGNHVAVHLAQERSDAMLVEGQQFETYNRLTAFLMHDLNNLIAQQSLIIKNAETHRRNPAFVDDAIKTIANSVERMRRVMDQLRHGAGENVTRLRDIRPVIRAAVARCESRRPKPRSTIGALDGVLNVDTEQFTSVLAHLIKNAQDATPPDGSVTISVTRTGDVLRIEVEDTGQGMTAAFIRDRLFRPFDSTKGSQGMGIGAYQAREFARKMGGELEVRSVPGEGSVFSMTLPVTPR